MKLDGFFGGLPCVDDVIAVFTTIPAVYRATRKRRSTELQPLSHRGSVWTFLILYRTASAELSSCSLPQVLTACYFLVFAKPLTLYRQRGISRLQRPSCGKSLRKAPASEPFISSSQRPVLTTPSGPHESCSDT